MRHPAIHFPSKDGDVPPYLENVFNKLTAGLAVKYGIDVADVTLVSTHKTDILAAIDKSEIDHDTAQASTMDKNNKIHNSKDFVLKMLNDIQDHGDFEEQDAEDLGMRVYTEPVDLETVKPVISRLTVLPEKVIIDFIKGTLEGVLIFGSYDGVTFTQIGKDTHSPFEDTRSNASDGAETRYYKLRYFVKDAPVGLESDIVKVVCTIP